MEEGGLVALVGQEGGNAADMVHGGRRQEEGFHEHGDTAEDRGHAIDALTTVAVRVFKGDALGNQ